MVNACAHALVKLGGNVIGGGRAVIVEDLVGADALDVIEVAREQVVMTSKPAALAS